MYIGSKMAEKWHFVEGEGQSKPEKLATFSSNDKSVPKIGNGSFLLFQLKSVMEEMVN
jgi:hypothetical protein